MPRLLAVLTPALLLGTLLSPHAAESQVSNLLMTTRMVMETVRNKAMIARSEQKPSMGVSTSGFPNDSSLIYTYNTKKTWIRLIDHPSGPKAPQEETAGLVGPGDEIIIMDYGVDENYVHRGGLHENTFFHISIDVSNGTGETDGQDGGQLFVRILRAKIDGVPSVYPSNWTDDEKDLVALEYGKKIRGFLEEYNSIPVAGSGP